MINDGDKLPIIKGAFSIKNLIPKANANPHELSFNMVDYWDILNFLTEPYPCVAFDPTTMTINFNIEEIINRYEELHQQHEILHIPDVDDINNKITLPLKNAKACYMVGNFLGTISLCGMICEMLITLIYDINGIYINGENIEDNHEIRNIIFNNSKNFDKIYQDQKIRSVSLLS